ncbi:hypothetical protein V8D89_000296 [Ganoderma adspersum]
MRLLDTETGQFVEKDRADEETVYAILSHTWDTENGEQTYKELKKIQRRYGPRFRAPQNHPGGLKGDALSSLDHVRGGPLPTPAPSQLVTAPLMPPSRPSKSWLTPRMTRLKGWFRYSSARNAPKPPGNSPSAPATACPSPSNLGQCQSEPPPRSIWDDLELSPKIRDACAVARKNGYRYIWIDSCCIDKSSSAELSEAINSMYRWYRLAAVCYAYLADVPPGDDHHAEGSRFHASRWFGRGWTLQELIAPGWVEFLSEDWAPIGSKQSLVELVESVANIHYKALLQLEPLEAFSVAQRLSWAAKRQTTRKEDRAYSLLGIFNIHMPTLYGEGDNAFRRLQEQIMQHIPDQSLFAWQDVYLGSQLSQNPNLADTPKSLCAEVRPYYGQRHLLASFRDTFKSCERIGAPRRDVSVQLPSAHPHGIEYTSTPYGDLLLRAIPHSEDIQLDFPGSSEDDRWYLAILGYEHAEYSGHLLGRVCYIPPSEDEHYRPQTELKTVHIPHPDRPELLSSLQYQPYTAIKLVLLRETRDALRSRRGYAADLRKPDPPDLPTTHWLTLSGHEHTITVEFRHALENGGKRLTLDAEVKMSGSCRRVQFGVDSDLGSGDQADCHAVSCQWRDPRPSWFTKLDRQSVTLSAAGTGPLTVDLALDFVGTGVYILRVPASSAAESAAGREDWEEAGGHETAGVEARDVAAASDNTGGEEGCGALP